MKTINFNIEEIIKTLSDALFPCDNEGLVYKEEISNTTGFSSTKKKTMLLYKVTNNEISNLVSFNYVISPKDEEQNKRNELYFIGVVAYALTKYTKIT